MRKALALSMLFGLAGCGGGENASAFVGLWTGTYSTTIDSGPPTVTSGTLQIDDAGNGQITTGPLCLVGGNTPWSANGAGGFSVGTIVCPVLSHDCSSSNLTVEGGTASLSQGTLVVTLSIQGVSCLSTRNSTSTFTGTK